MSEEEIIENWPNMRQQQQVQLATQEAYWQHYRIQAAIEIIGRATFNFDKLGNIPDDDFAVCAKKAVQMADALIAELQKKGGQDETRTD